ncbi:POT family MFS transporter [Panacibacter ginsenosidivorans]|uniref:POT family MFS transporter n=1 Tax=Panacibacter ginsenosidivorans TaxID=1813871 RepID=A0A5B8VCB9_9BACT|nr:POT family MFS transporter [Panacibacter ginsenosidivorans]QEC68326.1 POT family MFS transporter [Panacibacter ginsenosidivorans]
MSEKPYSITAIVECKKMYLPDTMPTQKNKLPAGIPYIMSNEIAERFSFYGMSAILTTFLVRQFFNPANGILVLVFIPFFTFVLFPFLEKNGVKINPLNKFGPGFIVSLFSIGIYWLQTQIDKGFHPSIGWQFFAYMLLTIAEVLIYQTGLEYAYTQAPESMKSTIMAFFLLSLSIGNIILSLINGSIANDGLFSRFTGSYYYLFFIIVMLAATLFYFFIIKPYLRKPIL